MPWFWSQGFLRSRTSLMLDLVSVALVAILVLLAVVGIVMTALTGWLFYWRAFVAD